MLQSFTRLVLPSNWRRVRDICWKVAMIVYFFGISWYMNTPTTPFWVPVLFGMVAGMYVSELIDLVSSHGA